MDGWYDDPLILFNESRNYANRNPQGYKIMRRDGYEAQLPEMPWKINENDMLKRPKHEIEYDEFLFGGGTAYTVRCTKCGEHETKVYWDEDAEVHTWPNPPAGYCRGTEARIERWD